MTKSPLRAITVCAALALTLAAAVWFGKQPPEPEIGPLSAPETIPAICYGNLYAAGPTGAYASPGAPYSMSKINDNMFMFAYHEKSGQIGGNGQYFTLRIGTYSRAGTVITPLSSINIECTLDDCELGSNGWSDLVVLNPGTFPAKFVVIYSQAGPTGGCNCAGDRWGAARQGTVDSVGKVSLGPPYYYNGMYCNDTDHYVCPPGDGPGTSCGSGGQCTLGTGGDWNKIARLSTNEFVITWRDYSITSVRSNAAIHGQLDGKLIKFGPRVDVTTESSDGCCDGQDPQHTDLIPLDAKHFLLTWSRGNAGYNGYAAIGTVVGADGITFGPITPYQLPDEEGFAFTSKSIALTASTFAVFYNVFGESKAIVGSYTGDEGTATITFEDEDITFGDNTRPLGVVSTPNQKALIYALGNRLLGNKFIITDDLVDIQARSMIASGPAYGELMGIQGNDFIVAFPMGVNSIPNLRVSRTCP